MAHPGNLEKTSALEPVCRLFFYDLGFSAPCRKPLFRMEYLTWIALAQVFWILVFGIFLLLYYPILTRPRIDGLPG